VGVQELLIVFAILLLFFGAKKLPGLAGSLGTSIKEFRKAAESVTEDDDDTAGSSRAATDGANERADRDRAERDRAERDTVDRDVER
jgi:sec-independent protein translocase protein TatA